MPGCNPAFRPDKKLDVFEIKTLIFFITSRPAVTGNRGLALTHEIE